LEEFVNIYTIGSFLSTICSYVSYVALFWTTITALHIHDHMALFKSFITIVVVIIFYCCPSLAYCSCVVLLCIYG